MPTVWLQSGLSIKASPIENWSDRLVQRSSAISRAKYDTGFKYVDEGTSAEKLEVETLMLTDKYFAYLQLEKFWEPTSCMNRPVTIVRQPREKPPPSSKWPAVVKGAQNQAEKSKTIKVSFYSCDYILHRDIYLETSKLTRLCS